MNKIAGNKKGVCNNLRCKESNRKDRIYQISLHSIQ